MPLVGNDDVIRKFTAKATYYAFNIGVLPGRSRCGDNLVNAQARRPSPNPITNYAIAVSKGNASTICWVVHYAEACSVTLTCTILRRSCARTRKTNSTLNVAIGTTRTSAATNSFKYKLRIVRQVAEGNLSPRGLCLSRLILRLESPTCEVPRQSAVSPTWDWIATSV